MKQQSGRHKQAQTARTAVLNNKNINHEYRAQTERKEKNKRIKDKK